GGDLPGNWGGGKTPVGWVPDPDDGPGKGSGHGPGVGNPEPPKHADPGPGVRPAPAPPAPAPPPAPAMVSVRVCSNSGLLPGPYCTEITTQSFVEGKQPTKICDKCQPPHKSRLADRAEPQLISDSRLTVPSSVPERLSLKVEIQYMVTADGDVTDVIVTRSSGYKALDRAVVSAASRMKYKPAVQDGVPRSVKRTRSYTINT
ncbi:MAG: TonB family protein, partial [Armatimonadota bacterium]